MRQNILVRRSIRLSAPGSRRKEKDELFLPIFSIGSLQKCFNAESCPFFALTCALVRGLPGVYTGEFPFDRAAFPIVYKRVKVDKSTQMRSLRTIALLYLLLFNVRHSSRVKRWIIGPIGHRIWNPSQKAQWPIP
jgi:hypothetical protein